MTQVRRWAQAIYDDVCDDVGGVTALEYALIAAFVALIMYSGASVYGLKLRDAFSNIATNVTL